MLLYCILLCRKKRKYYKIMEELDQNSVNNVCKINITYICNFDTMKWKVK